MCGRIALYTPPARLARLLDATLADDVDPAGTPSWNLAPTREVLGLIDASVAKGASRATVPGRVLETYHWGLVPSWAPDLASGGRLFNARAETIATRPAFRTAFEDHRLTVMADGFYEWRKGPGAQRQPYYFQRADGQPMAMAGLWAVWRDPAAGAGSPWVRSCTIITTRANGDLAGIHDRMPVVLNPDRFEPWLDPTNADSEGLRALLEPAAEGQLVHRPVDPRVGNVRNDNPQLIAPAAEQPTLSGLGEL
jgi:putative SOS response-associated peptidase YedK